MATRIMKYQAHPNGAVYFRVVEIITMKPRVERTLKSLGANPSRARLMRACREFDCRLPRYMRGKSQGAKTNVK